MARPGLCVLGFCHPPLAFVAHTDAQVWRIHGIAGYALFAAYGSLEGNMPCRDIVVPSELGALHISPLVLQAIESLHIEECRTLLQVMCITSAGGFD